jgi:hypothetical protein
MQAGRARRVISTYCDDQTAQSAGGSRASMALDRPHDDGAGDAAPEWHPHHGRPGAADAAAARAEPAESRTRAECYEALRAADHGSAHDTENRRPVDTETDHSGWNEVADVRPPLDALRVTSERATHILDGDADGSGGHRHGTGRPGKTEFPVSWDDTKITDTVLDVARRPDRPPVQQEWNGRWVARGVRDDVDVVVVIAGDGRIWTCWPLPGGPGVVKNPKET